MGVYNEDGKTIIMGCVPLDTKPEDIVIETPWVGTVSTKDIFSDAFAATQATGYGGPFVSVRITIEVGV